MAYFFRKKRRFDEGENDSKDEDVSKESFADFKNLPDLVLIKIFNCLNFEDRCNAAFVCHRWYNVSRSAAVWTTLDVHVKHSLHLLKSLLILPRSVTYLSIYCDSLDKYHPLWLPDILTRLHERCPAMSTLIIENVFFASRFCNARLTTDHVLEHSFEAEENYNSRYVLRCTKECCSEKINQDKYIPENHPRELGTFSLRYAYSYISHLSSQISLFLPNVKVLDLTASINFKPAAIPFFLKLRYLEELYLVECKISNYALETLLKHLKCLKVLDLEGSRDILYDTFKIIEKHGNSLEELYLGNTEIQSFSLSDEDTLPNLQRLCIKNTDIDDYDFCYFVVPRPNLKYIDASFCNLFLQQIPATEEALDEKEFVYENEGDPSALCHHFKTKHM